MVHPTDRGCGLVDPGDFHGIFVGAMFRPLKKLGLELTHLNDERGMNHQVVLLCFLFLGKSSTESTESLCFFFHCHGEHPDGKIHSDASLRGEDNLPQPSPQGR